MKKVRFVEIHAATEPEALNGEWFILSNDGDAPFNTRNCELMVRRKGSRKSRSLGTIDPGFVIGPGERMRVLTGNPGKKAHGAAPSDDTSNYSLFLNAPVLSHPGIELALTLRTLPVAKARWNPETPSGVDGLDAAESESK
jgi:hypothetical protein